MKKTNTNQTESWDLEKMRWIKKNSLFFCALQRIIDNEFQKWVLEYYSIWLFTTTLKQSKKRMKQLFHDFLHIITISSGSAGHITKFNRPQKAPGP